MDRRRDLPPDPRAERRGDATGKHGKVHGAVSIEQDMRTRERELGRQAEDGANSESALLNAWDRLIAIAALYPASNGRFREIAAEWREKLTAVAPTEAVVIEVGRDGRLAHDGRVHAPEQVGKSRLYPLLADTGVETVTVERGIDAEALHRFIAIFRELGQIAERSIGFQRVELPELPPGIAVRLRRFSTAERQGIVCAEPEADAELGPGEAPLVSEDPDRLAEEAVGDGAGATHNPHVGAQSAAGRRLEELLTFGATALHRRLTETESEEEAESAEPEPLPDAPDPESPPQSAAPPRREATEGFDTAELKRRLAEAEAAGAGFMPEERDPAEWLALVLKLTLHDDLPGIDEQLQEQLTAALVTTPDLQAVQILLSALEELISRGSAEAVDHRLPRVFAALGEHEGLRSRLLAELYAGSDARGLELLWPHLADALLRGLPGLLPAVLADNQRLLPGFDADELGGILPRLEALPALLEGRIHASLFAPRQPALNGLYIALLHSSRGQTAGGFLMRALRESPPAQPYADLIALLGGYRARYREFIRQLLAAECGRGGYDELPALGGALAFRRLGRIKGKGRERPELRRVLDLLAFAADDIEPLLERICNERRWLFLRAWPADLRKRAQALLLRRRGRPGEEVGA